MNAETLARWQFGITTVYHFFFVPVTLALSISVAVLQTLWVKTSDDKYLRLTKFYGKLFLINFAMGVVTGIVQEFQFGMNWSEYSRFVGDIFGAPLAFEALLAFFMESTFLGVWIFGWDRLPKKVHLATIWLGAIGTNISAIFILAANSWMQNPVGAKFNPITGRAEMVDFIGVVLNPVGLVTIAHTLAASWMVVGGLILAISGWHLSRYGKSSDEKVAGKIAAHRWAVKFGAIAMIIAGAFTMLTGDLQGKEMVHKQPMKMAAAEAHFETSNGAGFKVVAFPASDPKGFSIEVPNVLSLLATNSLNGKVEGINDLEKKYKEGNLINPDNELEKQFAQNLDRSKLNYVPSIEASFWNFRLMLGLGMLAFLIGIVTFFKTRKGGVPENNGLWRTMFFIAPLAPLFACSAGWILTEIGRQPWLVNGVLPTSASVSPGVTAVEVLITMVLFTLIYGILAVVEVGLFYKYVKLDLPEAAPVEVRTDPDAPMSFAY